MIIAFIFIIFFIILMLILLVASILTIIGKWKVFEKANKPGYAAIIPFYNSYTTYELGNFPPLLMLLNIGIFIISIIQIIISSAYIYDGEWLIPLIVMMFTVILSISTTILMIVEIICNINIAKKFNKTPLYGLGLAMLPFVFYMMLGFEKNSKYEETTK